VGFVMPSKVYACLASRLPLLFVGSAASDVDLLTRAARVPYWRVDCGKSAAFADILEEFADFTKISAKKDVPQGD